MCSIVATCIVFTDSPHIFSTLGQDPSSFRICTGDVRATDCGPVKIEGVLAELDAADEFYFENKSSSSLFLFYNSSRAAPPVPRGGLSRNASSEQCTAARPSSAQYPP